MPPRSRSYYVNDEYPRTHPYAGKPLGISEVSGDHYPIQCLILFRMISVKE